MGAPGTPMKKRHKVFLALAVFWLVFMAAMSPWLTQAWHYRKEVDLVFASYTDAVKNQKWKEAYQFSTDEFRTATSFEAFVDQQRELGKRGAIQAVTRGKTVVRRTGTPPRWIAELHADIRYPSDTAHMVYWFYREEEGWKLEGYRVR